MTIETDVKLYTDLCATFEQAMTPDQRLQVKRHAAEAFRTADGHRLTAIETLQAVTGLPRRIAETFIDEEYNG